MSRLIDARGADAKGSRRRGAAARAVGVVTSLLVLAACGSPRARDISGAGRRRSDAGTGDTLDAKVPAAPSAEPAAKQLGPRPRVVARASARALALAGDRLYFGDTSVDALFSIPIAAQDAESTRLGRRAPVDGALATSPTDIVWVGSPGDTVFRMPLAGAAPSPLKEHGIFTDVAAAGGAFFVSEMVGSGGALWVIAGTTTTRLATLDSPPRAIAVDLTHVYISGGARLLRTPIGRGAPEVLAVGAAFGAPSLDASFVYVIASPGGSARIVARVPKAGGPSATVAGDVRDAPIAIAGGEVFYFDATAPELRASPTTGGPARVVATDETFAAPLAITADETSVYVAAGEGESGVIFAIPRKTPR